MTSLKDFFDSKEYKDNLMGRGLPQGDTFFELTKLNISLREKNFDNNKTTSYFLDEGESNEGFFVPVGVVKEIEKIFKENKFPFVRVTRVGLTKNDTRYTVIGVLKK